MLRATPDAASDAAWARSQAASPTSSTSGGDAPTNAELQMWADEAIAGNLYEKIMEALSQTKYYQDLNGNDILDLIPKGLCLSEDQPGYLSCRHCLNKKSRRNVTFPTSVGVVNHFRRGSYHTPNSFLMDQLSSAATASAVPTQGPAQPSRRPPGHLVATSAGAAKLPSTSTKRPGQASGIVEGTGPKAPPPRPQLPASLAQTAAEDTGTHDTGIPDSAQLPASQAGSATSSGRTFSASSTPLSEAGLVAALKSYELQFGVASRPLRMHVLTQQMLLGGLEYDELLPLWAKRMKVILVPPPLFESIKLARTERGVGEARGRGQRPGCSCHRQG